MPTSTASRASPPSHLDGVLELVLADGSLTPRQRQDTASAVRTIARALGGGPEEIRAHPAALRERLKSFTPAMAGLSARRWANVLSLTTRALGRAGLVRTPGRSREPFEPEWTALFRMVDGMGARMALSRFARFCGARGIAPGQVGDAAFQAFLDGLTADSLVRLPRKVQRKAAVTWNHMAAREPHWPGRAVAVPDHGWTFALPWTAFPSSLKTDVDAYLDHLGGRDILAELDFKPLAPASLRTRGQQLRAFVSALAHQGVDPAALCGLRDVVAPETLKKGLRFFLDRAPDGSTEQAHGMAGVMAGVARHWVRADAAHLDALRAIRRRLDPGPRGLTPKNRERLRQFDDPDNVRRLLLLPAALAALASRAAVPARKEALLVQSAVAIELLLLVPMRRRNLALLETGRHLIRSRGGITHLAIPGHEVKNGTAIDAILPPSAIRLLDLYAARYRPLLATAESPFLFPDVGDRPKSRERLAHQISACVRDHCGLLVHPHLFRHIAAKHYLKAHPGAYGVVRLLHGHRSVETTARFYCGTETAAAVRHFDEHVLRLRGDPDGPGGARPRARRS